MLLAIGVVGSSAYDSKQEALLRPGEYMSIGDYTLIVRGHAATRRCANATEGRAAIRRDEGRRRPRARCTAGKNRYAAEQQTSSEVAIRSDYLTGEDLFLIADDLRKDGSVLLEVFVKPLVNLIWLAGLVFLSRLGRRAVAGRARGAAARDRYARARGSRARVTVALVLAAAARPSRRLRGRAAVPARAGGRADDDRLAGLDPTERRRLALLEERDRALAALSRSSSSTTARARSQTRTTASSSGRCGRVPRPR